MLPQAPTGTALPSGKSSARTVSLLMIGMPSALLLVVPSQHPLHMSHCCDTNEQIGAHVAGWHARQVQASNVSFQPLSEFRVVALCVMQWCRQCSAPRAVGSGCRGCRCGSRAARRRRSRRCCRRCWRTAAPGSAPRFTPTDAGRPRRRRLQVWLALPHALHGSVPGLEAPSLQGGALGLC